MPGPTLLPSPTELREEAVNVKVRGAFEHTIGAHESKPLREVLVWLSAPQLPISVVDLSGGAGRGQEHVPRANPTCFATAESQGVLFRKVSATIHLFTHSLTHTHAILCEWVGCKAGWRVHLRCVVRF